MVEGQPCKEAIYILEEFAEDSLASEGVKAGGLQKDTQPTSRPRNDREQTMTVEGDAKEYEDWRNEKANKTEQDSAGRDRGFVYCVLEQWREGGPPRPKAQKDEENAGSRSSSDASLPLYSPFTRSGNESKSGPSLRQVMSKGYSMIICKHHGL
nr:hypothetical protein CFP56_44375 [Quercus suber]